MAVAVEGITAGTLPQQHRRAVQDGQHTLAHKRLSEVFGTAKSVPFDDSSRIVLFSDCHRGDNSRADAFARNEELFLQALTHYYREGFMYVEVGDGDELWKNRRFSAIRDAHGRIFDLLHRFDLQNRLHLIVGNHDIQDRQQRWVEKDGMVAHEGLILYHWRTGQRIFVVHGHQADFKSDRLHVAGRFAARHIWKRLQVLGLGSHPSQPGDTRNRGKIRQRITEWLQVHQHTVICGHTHHPAFAARGAPPYFNTGSCLYSGYITGLEIQNGEIMLVKWSARPGEAPRIKRELIAPARKLHLLN